MVQESDIVREEINETRDQLTEKLVTLEDKIRLQVQTAKSAADETIESVRDVVRRVNPRFQIEERPLIALGASVGVGLLAGSLVAGRVKRARLPDYGFEAGLSSYGELPEASESVRGETGLGSGTGAGFTGSRRAFSPERPKGPGLWEKFTEYFGDEIAMAKGMLLTAVAEGARDLLKEPLPQFAPQIEKIVESVKRKVAPSVGAEDAVREIAEERRSSRSSHDEENYSAPT